MRPRVLALIGFIATAVSLSADPLPRGEIESLRTLLEDSRDLLRDYYLPNEKFTSEFVAQCKAADRELANVQDRSSGFGFIAATLQQLDRRIYFLPPNRAKRVDYGFEYRFAGEHAYISQLDRDCDARKQGVALGDRIESIDGFPVTRANDDALRYLLFSISPRSTLHLVLRAAGAEPREVTAAATLRERRRIVVEEYKRSISISRLQTEARWQAEREIDSPRKMMRRIGDVAVWRAIGIESEDTSVSAFLKEAAGAKALIIDLRDMGIYKHETAEQLIGGLFNESFEFGHIARGKGELDTTLRTRGSSHTFLGTVLVLVDQQTCFYAEVVAQVLQQKQRAVIVGDRTNGSVLEQRIYGVARGATHSVTLAAVIIPRGEIVVRDAAKIDGIGLAPDYQIFPAAEDFAKHRDPVLSRALALVKQKITPEEAFTLLRLPAEDMDDL